MLERQIMFKQLQELQRQKKLQELNDARQQNVIDQLSLMHNKQASGAQYSPLNSGIPVRDVSQMFMFGTTNLVQGLSNGLVYSQAQNQVLPSMGLASQQLDGIPMSSTGHSSSQYSHFQGLSRESVSLFTKHNSEQAATFGRSFIGDQFNVSSDQERSLLGPAFTRGFDIRGQTGKVQQVNDHHRYASSQELAGGREGGWPGCFSERMENVSAPEGLANLDPLEQKILFNVEDNSWETSLGKHGGMEAESFENMFGNTDPPSDFPSVQSGSWSALMQSAVAEASSSDAGLQEEWSGLSFQNPEHSNENQYSNTVKSGKHPTSWLHNNLPKSEHLTTSNASLSFTGFQQFPATHFQNPKTDDKHFPVLNSTAHASHNMLELLHKVDKEHSPGTESGYTDSAPRTEVPETEPANAFTPSHNSSSPSQYFGLRLAPPTQRPLYFDPSQISQQASHSNKATLSYTGKGYSAFSPDASEETSHNVSVKNEDGQQSSIFEAKQPPTTSGIAQQVASSTRPPSVWVDVPVQQSTSGMGSCKPPGTSDAANSRMESAFEASKELDYWKYVKGGHSFLEAGTQTINLQGFDDGRGFASKTYFGKESLSGNPEANVSSSSLVHGSNRVHHHGNHAPAISPRDLEAFTYSLKQANASSHKLSLLDPMNSEPSIRAAFGNEQVNYDNKIPQVTSASKPSSAYGNCKTQPILSAARGDPSVKSSSQPPLQDNSPGMVADSKAPSWLKNHEDSTMMSVYAARVSSDAAQQLLVGGPPESLQRNSYLGQVNLAGTGQYGSVGPITGTNEVAHTHLSSPYLHHLDVVNQNMVVLKSKKRKYPAFEFLPWHKEVTKGSSRLQDMSTAEVEWAYATSQLSEKLKEQAEEVADSLYMVRPKKRLILTTRLMQLLFRPAPAAILSEDATSQYDIVTYHAAKLALGDACSLASRSHTPHDTYDSPSGKSVASVSSGDQDLLRIVEGFYDRSKRLEDKLLRLENGGSSFLDVTVEFQDLEKFSVINRFAKFHGRGPLVAGVAASSGGASTMPKLYPQRYVTASPMPKTVPEGLHCLSL